MKKKIVFNVLLLLFLGAIISSCNKDNDELAPDIVEVDSNGYDYVDLGLSVYWATCNIGASSPYDYGDYYAFGETVTKNTYTSDNYMGGNKDIAKISWGGTWRLPTESEINELISKCYWKIEEKNGDDIMKVKGPNGNAIEFPFAGSKVNGGMDKGGFYWSSSLSSSGAWCLYFNYNKASCSGAYKYCGLPIRPVMTNPDYTPSSDDNFGNDDQGGNNTTSEKPEIGFYDFTATKTSLKVQYKIYNKDEADVKSAKIYYGTTSNPTASKSASISGTMITANITGLKAGTTYYVKCSVTGKAGTTTTEVTKCITNY